MQTETLIVGGGLSGLAIADRLSAEGRDFLLVEAQDRLGGRVLTETLSGGQFDLGPAWFWPGQPRMAALVRRFDVPVFEQFGAGDTVYQDRSGTVQRLRGFPSMQGSYRLDGGVGRLIESLQSSIDSDRVLLGTKLQALSEEQHGATATILRNGEIIQVEAVRVVLALPPRVVAEAVQFEPALGTSQVDAMADIPTWMAGQAKILAVYDHPHWRDAGLSGNAMSHRGPMVEIHDASPMESGPYALFGFVGVPPEARLAHPDRLKELAREQLVALFGDAMAQPLDLVLKDWASVSEVSVMRDRTPLGGHPSYGLPGGLRSIWDGRVTLASTETAPGFGGFLEGALEAAERVLHSFAPKRSNVA